ncbi:exported hypothetical protein [Mesorhizobium sp. ORS 3359]|nr:exported hypothetical protein [Mesorhizobium sp. ORS 3359]
MGRGCHHARMAAAFTAAVPPVGTAAEDQVRQPYHETAGQPAVLANGIMDFKYAWPLPTTD